MTNGVNERPYLSIGEVLGLLLDEFPDVTISKIRFLESQGLIEPERTSSGYRKFFDADIERLRLILREQRENFLPLRVIRDRLETGAIDDSGSIATPAGTASSTSDPTSGTSSDPASDSTASDSASISPLNRGIRHVRVDEATVGVADAEPAERAGVADTTRHPAGQGRALAAVPERSADPTPTGMLLRDDAPLDVLSRSELCEQAAITSEQLGDLESYGLVAARGSAAAATYTPRDLAIVRAAAGFLERGVDARHLRGWRQSAEREVGLFEQRILPLLRQRNPQARLDAVQLVTELADLGAELRQALIVAMLRPHLDAHHGS